MTESELRQRYEAWKEYATALFDMMEFVRDGFNPRDEMRVKTRMDSAAKAINNLREEFNP